MNDSTNWFSQDTEVDKLKKQLGQKGGSTKPCIRLSTGLTDTTVAFADIRYANLQSDLDIKVRELDEMKLNMKEALYKVCRNPTCSRLDG